MNSKKEIQKKQMDGGSLDTKFRCAADVDYIDGSCYSIDQLKLLANIINKSIKKNILKGDPIKIINNKHFLLEQLKDRLKECKDDQTCWLKKKFVRSSNEIGVEDVFRPDGTAGKIDWLSTENIDNVMEQYERKYTDYFFFGAVPIDFHEINYNKLGKINYDDLMMNGDKEKNEMMVEFHLKKFYWKYFEILQVYNKFRGKPNKYPFAEFHNDIKKTPDTEIEKNLDNFFSSSDYNTFMQNYSVVENNGEIEVNDKNQNKNDSINQSGGLRKMKGGVETEKIKKIIYNKIISIKNKKYPITKIGIVPNLDEHWQNGSHWVSLYADLVKGEIYYFDSYGYRPEPRLRGLAKRIGEWKYKKDTGKTVDIGLEDWMTTDNKNLNEIEKKYDIRYSTIRNQYKNSECGVYSMNFIIRLLNGSKFDNIIKEPLEDDVVNQCREIYFNNQEIIPDNSKENFIVTNEKGGKIDVTKKNYKCE
jgi:hypothetical protein